MFIQTIFMVAVIFALGFGLLTTQLVAVRHSFQTTVTTKARLSLENGVLDAESTIANIVAIKGTHGPWPQTKQTLFTRPVCSKVDVAAACAMSSTATWRVTGSTSGPQQRASDTAQNLQTVELDEQRLAIRVANVITNKNGQVLASMSRDVTFRLLDSAPYAVEVGVQDSETASDDDGTSQGDLGGNTSLHKGDLTTPDENDPTRFSDTTVKFSMVCHDAIQNGDMTNAVLDNHLGSPGMQDGNNALPWGTGPGAYETPCSPLYGVSGPPDDGVHSKRETGGPMFTLNDAGITSKAPWTNGD